MPQKMYTECKHCFVFSSVLLKYHSFWTINFNSPNLNIITVYWYVCINSSIKLNLVINFFWTVLSNMSTLIFSKICNEFYLKILNFLQINMILINGKILLKQNKLRRQTNHHQLRYSPNASNSSPNLCSPSRYFSLKI